MVKQITKMSEDWSVAVTDEDQAKEIDFDEKYFRISSFEQEQFESDTILLHGETGRVIVLNEVAAVLWQALAWGQRPSELLELLQEAQPDEPGEQLSAALAAALSQLMGGDFIQKAETGK